MSMDEIAGAPKEGGRDDAEGRGGDAEGVRQDAGSVRRAQTLRTALEDAYQYSTVKPTPSPVVS